MSGQIGEWDGSTPPSSPQHPMLFDDDGGDDDWARDEDRDQIGEEFHTYDHSVVQSYTPAPISAPVPNYRNRQLRSRDGSAREPAPPSAGDASIVVSSLSSGQVKAGVHFTEHDKRRKQYLMRRLRKQLRGPDERSLGGEVHVMPVAHGPGP